MQPNQPANQLDDDMIRILSAIPKDVKQDVKDVVEKKWGWLVCTCYWGGIIIAALSMLDMTIGRLLDVETQKAHPYLTSPWPPIVLAILGVGVSVIVGKLQGSIQAKKDAILLWCYRELYKEEQQRRQRANRILNDQAGQSKNPTQAGANAEDEDEGDATAPEEGDATAPEEGDATAPEEGDATAPEEGDAATDVLMAQVWNSQV